MNQSSEKAQLSDLLRKVDTLEVKRRRRLLLATVIPIVVAAGLLYYFITRIAKASKQVTNLNGQVRKLNRESDSLNTRLADLKKAEVIFNRSADSVKGVYDSLHFNFKKDFGWSEKDLIIKNKFTRSQGKLAHDSIISFLKSSKINPEIAIRYYTKKSDKGIIDNTIKKCGFRSLYVFTSNYNDSSGTNAIKYSKNASSNDVKLIAYALLRGGVELRYIGPFSKESEMMGKDNSIEIYGDLEYKSRPKLTVGDINRFKIKHQVE